jgi:hypothetical protein
MQTSGYNEIAIPKLEWRMSNKVYPPSGAPPASPRLVKGDQGIPNDEADGFATSRHPGENRGPDIL